jgi:hypothetical protein
MKHIPLFEEFVKNYGQKMTTDEFEKIGVGQTVLYKGTKFEVEENTGVTLVLKPLSGSGTQMVNLSQFIQGGAITESEETLNEGTIVSDLIKMFGDAKEWGVEMKDRVYPKGNNLVFIDSFYYGGTAALESLRKSWLPGGTYYEYFVNELKLKPTIMFAFSEMKAVGRHKKFTNDGVVGVEISFEKI